MNTTGREPQLGGQPQGNEPMLGGEDWQLRCDWCNGRVTKTTLYFGSSEWPSAYSLCSKCFAKVEGLDRIQRKHRGGITIRVTGIAAIRQVLRDAMLIYPYPTAEEVNRAIARTAAQIFRTDMLRESRRTNHD